MQSHHGVLNPTHLELLYQEWEQLNSPTQAGPRKPGPSKETCEGSRYSPELSPVVTVLPGLIRLVNECTDRPVTKFRPTIKRLILEQLFMDVAGDSIVDPHQNVQIESYVELAIRVLERVRQNTLGRDEWSDAPVTPQMFG